MRALGESAQLKEKESNVQRSGDVRELVVCCPGFHQEIDIQRSKLCELRQRLR